MIPEYSFPRVLQDGLVACRALLEEGASVVGAIVTTIMAMAMPAGAPPPARGIAFSPWVDLAHSGATMQSRNGLDPEATKAGLDFLLGIVLDSLSPSNSRAPSLFMDATRLPPTMIRIGAWRPISPALRIAEGLHPASMAGRQKMGSAGKEIPAEPTKTGPRGEGDEVL